MKWIPFPMIRIAGFFTGGVLLGIYQPDFVRFNVVIALILVCLISFLALRFLSRENKLGFYSGATGLLIVFLLGYSRLLLSTDSRKENHLSKITDPIEAYEAIVRSVPEEKAKSWKIQLEIATIKTRNEKQETNIWQPVSGNLLLYVSKKNNTGINWKYGDKILVKGNPQELNPPANPGEFDFKRFLSFKNISHQQFVSLSDVKLISHTSNKGFIFYSHQARAWCMKKLNEFVHGDDERAIAIALVLGVTDGIDNDLQNAYAASGANI